MIWYTGIRRNLLYGTKTKKKEKLDFVVDFTGAFGGGRSSGLFGVG